MYHLVLIVELAEKQAASEQHECLQELEQASALPRARCHPIHLCLIQKSKELSPMFEITIFEVRSLNLDFEI